MVLECYDRMKREDSTGQEKVVEDYPNRKAESRT